MRDLGEKIIRERLGDPAARIALVLGSGLGSLADDLEGRREVAYSDLPGWPEPSVAGHRGRLLHGTLGGTEVLVLQGRGHYYEHGDGGVMRKPVETLKALGVETLVLTNAAGSLHEAVPPGSVVAIEDHINLTGRNPLIGDDAPERFVDMRDAYAPRLRERLSAIARNDGWELPSGVYMWFSGPSFETPAEIRMARVMGATLVGMSTVPEVILARRFGMEVAALSIVTNMGAGMSAEALSHAHTQSQALLAADRAKRLLLGFVAA